jgi:hypothetical protein
MAKGEGKEGKKEGGKREKRGRGELKGKKDSRTFLVCV